MCNTSKGTRAAGTDSFGHPWEEMHIAAVCNYGMLKSRETLILGLRAAILKPRIVVAIILFLVIATGAWWYFRDTYPANIAKQLRGDLRKITFQPRARGELISVTDLADMEAIRATVLAANELSLASWPPTTCSLNFHFKDRGSVAMKMSPTNPSDVRPSDLEPRGYVILGWEGHQRGADSQPFIAVLKK